LTAAVGGFAVDVDDAAPATGLIFVPALFAVAVEAADPAAGAVNASASRAVAVAVAASDPATSARGNDLRTVRG
jgi:hypothetical protein